MKNYKMLGGGMIAAETNAELVLLLNSQSMFGHKENVNEFMESTSEACRFQTGAAIRFDTFDNFVDDLITNGFLTEISTSDTPE